MRLKATTTQFICPDMCSRQRAERDTPPKCDKCGKEMITTLQMSKNRQKSLQEDIKKRQSK